MRVLCYTDTFLPLVGGAETVLDNLARQLTRRGDSVTVLAPRVRGAPPDDDDHPYAVRRYRKPFSKRVGVRLILPRLLAMHRRQRYDVIHCHSAYPPAYVALSLRRLTGLPVVVRPHGSDVLPGRRIRASPHVERRLRRALAGADAIIAQGSFLRDAILDLGVDERRVHVIHNGVDRTAFATASPFPHPRPYILGLGNLIPRKGFDILLRAYARLLDPPADLLIAGRGSEEAMLRGLGRELGIARRVTFVGFVEGQAKIDLYRSARFFVCPSRTEPFGNVILEAFAAGLPVVASAVGGNVELVAEGERGLRFDSGQDDALAACLRRLLESPDRVSTMGDAVTRYVGDFDWPAVAGRYADLYRSLRPV